MAYYRKRAGGWRAEIEKLGVRESGTFPTKAQAISWATQREAEILAGQRGELPQRYVSDAITKYAKEVSPKKRGERWELLRLAAMVRPDGLPFRNRVIHEVAPSDIAQWRDSRLESVSAGTVNREWNLLQAVFRVAKQEWGWLKAMPFEGVKRPANPKARSRRVGRDELDALCRHLGYQEGAPVTTKRQEVALAFLLAIESGMRAGEILSLTQESVNLACAKVHLALTKNADSRDVPLSKRAISLLSLLDKRNPLFSITPASLDALFRAARAAAAIELPHINTLHFHDSRHEACTRLSTKVSVLELARIIGHRDLKSLLIYYNPTPEELAEKLG